MIASFNDDDDYVHLTSNDHHLLSAPFQGTSDYSESGKTFDRSCGHHPAKPPHPPTTHPAKKTVHENTVLFTWHRMNLLSSRGAVVIFCLNHGQPKEGMYGGGIRTRG